MATFIIMRLTFREAVRRKIVLALAGMLAP